MHMYVDVLAIIILKSLTRILTLENVIYVCYLHDNLARLIM